LQPQLSQPAPGPFRLHGWAGARGALAAGGQDRPGKASYRNAVTGAIPTGGYTLLGYAYSNTAAEEDFGTGVTAAVEAIRAGTGNTAENEGAAPVILNVYAVWVANGGQPGTLPPKSSPLVWIFRQQPILGQRNRTNP